LFTGTKTAQAGNLRAVLPADDVSLGYEGTRMPADPPNEAEQIELNRLTAEVLAALQQFRIVDKVMVVRASQYLAFVAYPGNPTYLERLLENILGLADLVEKGRQLPLALELRSFVERWRSGESA
jgi:hypothetical protein